MIRETLFLKIAVFLMALPILALCIFGVPSIAREAAGFYPGFSSLPYFILIGLYITAAAFFTALYQALRLLSYIDKNKAFSDLSVKALQMIKYCAFTISGVYVAGLPFLYLIAEKDDAPGLIVIGLVIIFASMVVAVFAAVLQKLLRSAIDIKSENDLTV
ncbi:DUF2975 domain-containing protein [Halobacillus sp. Marseille-P3879]|uniref:DUF2975 domain-containing protein n=1 Tax=Halobacillus sp. Marseille-P3879 TaxID=2045014 RepID=UPI000C7C12E1|nr:DUF2975 domain-containing protein [Halobacillus sp. Marseille-P3879]